MFDGGELGRGEKRSGEEIGQRRIELVVKETGLAEAGTIMEEGVGGKKRIETS